MGKSNKPQRIDNLADLKAPAAVQEEPKQENVILQKKTEEDKSTEISTGGRRMSDSEVLAFFKSFTGRDDLNSDLLFVKPQQTAEEPQETVDINKVLAVVMQVMQNNHVVTAVQAPQVVYEDDDYEDDDDYCDAAELDKYLEDTTFWNPGDEWTTIGIIAGGAALIGVGCLVGYALTK